MKWYSRILCVVILLFAGVSSAAFAASAGKVKADQPPAFIGVDVDSLMRRIVSDNYANPVCGIWKASVDGATTGIVSAAAWRRHTGTLPPQSLSRSFNDDALLMVIISSPAPAIQPGTIVGLMTPAAKPGHYTARILTRQKGNRLYGPKNFVLNLTDDGHLTMTAIHKGLTINPWQFLPYMVRGISLRGVIRYTDNTPRDLDGFTRLWPRPLNPATPVIL